MSPRMQSPDEITHKWMLSLATASVHGLVDMHLQKVESKPQSQEAELSTGVKCIISELHLGSTLQA